MLSNEQKKFLNSEFNIPESEIQNISLPRWKEIRLKCFDIEGAEAMGISSETCILPDRGEIAASIVDTPYKALFS